PGSKRVAYSEGIFLGYRHFDRSAVKPLFPFGYGLSYTEFQYSNLWISREAHDVKVSFTLKNIGDRGGTEVAQIYVGDGHSHVPRPVKELKSFLKINLKAGEETTASVVLDRRAFAYYDTSGKRWKIEPGPFKISVGGSSQKIGLAGYVTLNDSDIASLADSLDTSQK
ncbi:MAG TPA: fibronectin type III-like domain-contianing protein, partial [Terriglobales bacterium]|nr:fibronectin type III-like domain-contianing protein [Terriglobales bacterium]